MSDLDFKTGSRDVDDAFRIAWGDLAGNIQRYQDGWLDTPKPVILAGLDYRTPWTRDAAINAWNAASLLLPDVSRDTLLSVLARGDDGEVEIGGQYWDRIIWTTGAWWHYLCSGDREFLGLALRATRRSLRYFEETEFDGATGLFRGAACYGDGVSAYPDAYADAGGEGGILAWPEHHPETRSQPGYGIPMEPLSTNCLYMHAYALAGRMARELGERADASWAPKAAALKQAINRLLWSEEKGRYLYLIGPMGACDHAEGLGHALAILFGIADGRRAEAIFRNQPVTPHGVPCVWPTFRRYESSDGMAFGRHSGTVWPHVQGLWAQAAMDRGRTDIFLREFRVLTEHANRDSQFTEIYHPLTGEPYGGMQEGKGVGTRLWLSRRRQTWSATAYMRMALLGLMGIRLDTDGMRFEPWLPPEISGMELGGLRYRRMTLHVRIEGSGGKVAERRVDGRRVEGVELPGEGEGERTIEIRMSAET